MFKKSIVVFSILILVLSTTVGVFAGNLDRESKLNLVKKLGCDEVSESLVSSVKMGKLDNPSKFDNAVVNTLKKKIDWAVSANNLVVKTGLQAEVERLASKIYELDRDHVSGIRMNEKNSSKLFLDYNGKFPKSYDETLKLAMMFNPAHNTNDNKRLNKEINKYLSEIENNPVIQYALKVTNTDISDLKRNWFGSGRGFEHVIAGELKGSKVSGYHWWYRFYRDERRKSAFYGKSIEGLNDPDIFTGSFKWDPDGPGNKFHSASKRKGGFCIGASAPAILALGHIAVEVSKKYGSPSTFRITANINGETYRWQVYMMGHSIRSLYPISNKSKNISNDELKKRANELIIDDVVKPMLTK